MLQQERARERLWTLGALLAASFAGGAATHLSMAGAAASPGSRIQGTGRSG